MEKSKITRDFWVAVLRGLLLSLLGVGVAYLLLPLNAFSESLCSAEDFGFARKFDGSCQGWTSNLVRYFIVGSLLHWWAYVHIAYVIYRHHPILEGSRTSQIVIYLTSLFILGCGVSHLIAAYTAIHPVYSVEVVWLVVNGIISCLAMLYVTYGLLRTVIATRDINKNLDELA